MTKILERENYSNGYRLSVVSSTDLLCDVIYKQYGTVRYHRISVLVQTKTPD